MAKPLKEYRDRHGLSRESLAHLLSERLGRPITAGGVQRFENYDNLPSSWTLALGIEPAPAQPGNGSNGFVEADSWPGADTGEGPRSEEGGQPAGESGAWSPPSPPPVIYPHAQQRLEQMHAAVGAGLSMATGNQGFGAVFGAYGPSLAQQWVEAAKVDANARRVVEFMETGGAIGGLVVGYMTLALACVYVSGRAEPLGALFGGWRPYHDDARGRQQAARAAAAAEGRAGGPDPWSPEGWLAEDRAAPADDVGAGGARDGDRTDGLG